MNSDHKKISKTTLISQIRQLEQYEAWKRAVFIRDRFTCQECGARNGRKPVIEAHHLKELSALITENGISSLEQALDCLALWDTSNGQTLCRTCHQKTDSYPAGLRGKKGYRRINLSLKYK